MFRQSFGRALSNFRTRRTRAATTLVAGSILTSLVIEQSYKTEPQLKNQNDKPSHILRYDTAQLACNTPVEDTWSDKTVPHGQDAADDWYFWGIFDGHAGFSTAKKLETEFIDHVTKKLYQLFQKNPQPNTGEVDSAIRDSFVTMDNELVVKPVQAFFDTNIPIKERIKLLMPAISGSCGLISFFDPKSAVLKTAIVGDSRAILGSYDAGNDEWTVTPLTVDQTGSNEQEIARVEREHPGEEGVVKDGRVLGLMVTRAFGDARFKWALDLNTKVTEALFGYPTTQKKGKFDSAPYVNAEPVITTTNIDLKKDKFLVLASDGLYDELTNEQVAGLVVKWMQEHKMASRTKFETGLPKMRQISLTGEPAGREPEDIKNFDTFHLMQDDNVATHLIRNALSHGISYEESEKMAGIPPGLGRYYRDDITVTVVFFGDEELKAKL